MRSGSAVRGKSCFGNRTEFELMRAVRSPTRRSRTRCRDWMRHWCTQTGLDNHWCGRVPAVHQDRSVAIRSQNGCGTTNFLALFDCEASG